MQGDLALKQRQQQQQYHPCCRHRCHRFTTDSPPLPYRLHGHDGNHYRHHHHHQHLQHPTPEIHTDPPTYLSTYIPDIPTYLHTYIYLHIPTHPFLPSFLHSFIPVFSEAAVVGCSGREFLRVPDCSTSLPRTELALLSTGCLRLRPEE